MPFRVADLINSSFIRPTPYMPGSIGSKMGGERAEERAALERARRGQEAISQGQLALGRRRLGLQARAQQLAEQRRQEEQQAAIDAEQRKMREGAMRGWIKAYLSGDEAQKEAAAQNLKRFGFRVERTAPSEPEAVAPERVELKPFTPPELSPEESAMAEEVKLEPSPTVEPKKAEAFRAAQIKAKETGLPLSGSGLQQRLPPRRFQVGTRVFDPAGNLAWEDTDANVRRWYQAKAAESFRGLIDQHKEDPEATAAVLSGYEHTIGLIGSGIEPNEAIKEGVKLTEVELERQGKLLRAKIAAERPKGGGGGPSGKANQRMRTAWTQFKQMKDVYARENKFKVIVDAEADLRSVVNLIREDKRNGVADRITAQKVQKSLQGGRLSNYDMTMLFEAGGLPAQFARWYNYVFKGGELPDVFIKHLRSSSVDLLNAAHNRRFEIAKQFRDEAMGDVLIDVTPEEREAKANEGYKFFAGVPYGGSGGGGKTAKPQGKADPELKKKVMDLLGK